MTPTINCTSHYQKTGVPAWLPPMPIRPYIAGPMRGMPDNNIPQFNDAADQLRELGYLPFNPGEQPEDWDGTGDELAHYLQRDLPALLRCDSVIVLPGWTESQGACIEVDVATGMKMPVYDYLTGDRIDAMAYRPANPYPVETQPTGRQSTMSAEQYLEYLNGISGIEPPPPNIATRLVTDPVVKDVWTPNPEATRMVTNPVTGGQKETRGARPELVPAGPMWEVARLYGYGAEKYSPRNWERGYDWSLSIGALERHLLKFKMREDFDMETGCHHLASVVFHALALMEFSNTHPELDDRA